MKLLNDFLLFGIGFATFLCFALSGFRKRDKLKEQLEEAKRNHWYTEATFYSMDINPADPGESGARGHDVYYDRFKYQVNGEVKYVTIESNASSHSMVPVTVYFLDNNPKKAILAGDVDKPIHGRGCVVAVIAPIIVMIIVGQIMKRVFSIDF